MPYYYKVSHAQQKQIRILGDKRKRKKGIFLKNTELVTYPKYIVIIRDLPWEVEVELGFYRGQHIVVGNSSSITVNTVSVG